MDFLSQGIERDRSTMGLSDGATEHLEDTKKP